MRSSPIGGICLNPIQRHTFRDDTTRTVTCSIACRASQSRPMNRDRTSQPAAAGDRIDAAARRLLHGATAAPVFALLSGCSSAPSRNILGSYFPSWMICALIGMGATVAVRALLAKTGIDAVLPMPIVVYLAFATAF